MRAHDPADLHTLESLSNVLDELERRDETRNPLALGLIMELYAVLANISLTVTEISSKIDRFGTSDANNVDGDDRLWGRLLSGFTRFAECMAELNIFVVDLYYPGFSSHFRYLAGSDADVVRGLKSLGKEFGFDPNNPQLASLQGMIDVALNYPNARYGEAEIQRAAPVLDDLDIMRSGWMADDYRQAKFMRANESLRLLTATLQSALETVATVLRENWTFKELADRKVFGPMEVIMGDKFEHIINSTLINRSVLTDSFNKLSSQGLADVREALDRLAAVVSDSKNKDAAENFNAFTAEVSKPDSTKSVLKTLWGGVVSALPAVAQMTDIVDKIKRLWQ